MAPIARRPCLYLDGGCTWQTPQCDQIDTIAEAKLYVKLHSSECLFNPAVAEERTHRRQAEAAETTERREAEARREATKAEERREQRDYLRQQEAARVGAPKPGVTITYK